MKMIDFMVNWGIGRKIAAKPAIAKQGISLMNRLERIEV